MRKVAIITSETPNSLYAGSMQLLRVFRGYPSEKLVVAGPEPPTGARLLDCSYRFLRFPIMRWRNTRFHRPAMSLVVWSRWFRRSPRQVGKILQDFQADAVFTVMDNFSHYVTAYEYARATGIPLITMTMDEPDSFEKILRPLKGLQHRRIAEVYGHAERNLCVSHQMTSHIAKTYDCVAETFYFGPPDGVCPRATAEAGRLRRDGKLVLGFAGSLSYGYGEALEHICHSLEGSAAIVRIYSRDKPRWSAPNMEYAGCLPSEELWPKFKEECDASLLVYNFNYHESRLYRTHFPTKLSEYSWLGMPMVMVGPDYATGVIWGLDHPAAALVHTKQDLSSLPAAVEQLVASSEDRVAMAEATAKVAREDFDPVAIRERFWEVMGGERQSRCGR